MKIILEIKDNKVPFVLELLQHFKFVKTKTFTKKKDIREDIKEAIKELNLIRAGKMKGIPARELLNEL
ncbi:MAG: hypothetical protein ACPGTO_00485 [Polaribacter sp.]